MAKKYLPTIKKLQRAINDNFGQRILINKTQYCCNNVDKIGELIIIKQAQWDNEKGKFRNVELFSSPSDVQIVLWLRDYWYQLNGWEVPTDNKQWNEAKRKYEEKHNGLANK